MRDYKLLSSSLLALCGVATISLPTLCRPAQAFSLQGIKEKAPAESRIRIKKRDLRYPVAFNNDIYDYLTVRIGAGAPGSESFLQAIMVIIMSLHATLLEIYLAVT